MMSEKIEAVENTGYLKFIYLPFCKDIIYCYCFGCDFIFAFSDLYVWLSLPKFLIPYNCILSSEMFCYWSLIDGYIPWNVIDRRFSAFYVLTEYAFLMNSSSYSTSSTSRLLWLFFDDLAEEFLDSFVLLFDDFFSDILLTSLSRFMSNFRSFSFSNFFSIF